MARICVRQIVVAVLLASITTLLLASVSGCARFKSHKRLHLAPFAEDMIALAGDLEYGLGQLQPVYLQGYIEGPELEYFDVLGGKIRLVLRGIIGYSIQVVTLGESELSGPQRTVALADYLDSLLRPVIRQPLPPLQLTLADLDTILTDVRGRPDLLSGLRGSQPIVDEIARVAGELFNQAAVSLEDVRAAIEKKVDADFAEVRATDRKLRSIQLFVVLDIDNIIKVRRGDQAAADSLYAHQPSLHEILQPGEMPSESDMRQVEERLLFILNTVTNLRSQLAPDLDEYRQARRELGIVNNEYSAALRLGRVAIIAWGRAHGRLASGITDPAEINVLGIARKAAGGVLPF